MSDPGYVEVSEKELDSGVAFAKKGKRGEQGYPPTDLDRDFLRSLANKTRALKESGIGLYDAKTQVLNGAFRERTRSQQERRRAYSAAISHIFGKRSRWGKRRVAPLKKIYPADTKGQFKLF